MNNIAMAQAVQKACKSKFRGRNALKSKVVTHYPNNLTREYVRVANTYMTLLNKTLAEYLPKIRTAIYDERDQMRMDSANEVMDLISNTFMDIQAEFTKRATSFDLDGKIRRLSEATRRRSVREWKRVVSATLGISILEDYYMGEFFGQSLNQWTANNVNLIKSIPEKTLSEMQTIIREGFTAGKSNTTIGREIQKAYGTNRKQAQFYARDQMAKLNADLTKEQQQDAGVEEYMWSDSGDQRVRCRHEELNGTKHKWNEPPVVDKRTGRKAHPGKDYRCRCVALPVFNLPTLNLPWESEQ